MIAVFRGLAIGIGVACLVIGLAHVAFGPGIIRGGMEVNASVDSEDRFFGALFAFFGLAWIWAARDLVARQMILLFLSAAFFLGGVARLISMALVGWPDDLYVLLAAIELVLPVVFAVGLRSEGALASK